MTSPGDRVDYVYDTQNRWIAKTLDPDGDRGRKPTTTHFVYDLGSPLPQAGEGSGGEGGQRPGVPSATSQIILQLDESGQVTNRYLWGPNVDQFLADEQVADQRGGGNGNAKVHNQSAETLWALTDHLNTVRDLAVYDSESGLTAVANHLVYNAFGELISQTDAKTTTLFLFTARPFDPDTGLQNNLNRWYDASVGRWMSDDPAGFHARDVNLYRYGANAYMNQTDPSGLNPNQTGAKDGDEFLHLVRTIEQMFFERKGRFPTLEETVDILLRLQLQNVDAGSDHYYVFSGRDKRWIDMRHFFAAVHYSLGPTGARRAMVFLGGVGVELAQLESTFLPNWVLRGEQASAFGVEDFYSNDLGAKFAGRYGNRSHPGKPEK